MKSMRFTMTREQALGLGLLVCGNCGYPENNHFSWAPKPCAHDSNCKAYREVRRDLSRMTKEAA